MKKIITVILLSTLLGASCKKTNTPSPTDQLPPTTQTGANTFGCLVNGKVWIPKGYECNTKPNPSITYDFDFNGLPYLDIKTNHFVNCTPQGFMNISFSKLNHLGNFSFPSDFNF